MGKLEEEKQFALTQFRVMVATPDSKEHPEGQDYLEQTVPLGLTGCLAVMGPMVFQAYLVILDYKGLEG